MKTQSMRHGVLWSVSLWCLLACQACGGDSGAGGVEGGGDEDGASPCEFIVEAASPVLSAPLTAVAVSLDGASLAVAGPGGVIRLGVAEASLAQEASWTSQDSALASDEVATLVFDDQGRVWAGHGQANCEGTPQGRCGISLLDAASDQWTVIHSGNSDLIDDRVFALGVAADGALWAGTGAGAATTRSAGRSWDAYFDWQDCLNPGESCDPLFSFLVSGLAFDEGGDVWLAVGQQAIGVSPKPGGVARRLSDGRTETWDRDQGLPSNQASAVAVLNEGQVFAGGPYGLVSLQEDNTWSSPLIETPVTALAADGASLWVVTGGTLLRFSEVGAAPVDATAALPGAATSVSSAAGVTCVGTEGGVVCHRRTTCTWF